MSDAYAVSYIHEGMRGAPVVNGLNGTLIAALDALLITGWGLATAATLTVAGGVATATFSANTLWEPGAVIEVSGAVPGAVNGLARVQSSSDTVMTFPTAAADGTYTGTISIKYAAAGWQKPFTGTNLAAYRSQDVASPKHYLRVRDSYGMYSTVAGFESMTAISTGTARFSRAASLDSNQSSWEKSQAADARPVPYLLAADSRAMLIALSAGIPLHSMYATSNVRGFGDPVVLAPGGDPWCTFLSASTFDQGGSNEGALSGSSAASGSTGSVVVPRRPNGTAGVQSLGPRPMTASTIGMVSGDDAAFGPAPSAIDGSVLLSRMQLVQADGTPRAFVPGMWYVPQSGAAALFGRGDVLAGAGDLIGRRLRAVSVGNSIYSPSGIAFVDLTGPWR